VLHSREVGSSQLFSNGIFVFWSHAAGAQESVSSGRPECQRASSLSAGVDLATTQQSLYSGTGMAATEATAAGGRNDVCLQAQVEPCQLDNLLVLQQEVLLRVELRITLLSR
jgi:hypothetical protein